jgi:hypothetical protein
LSFASNDSEEKLDWMNEWSLSTAKIFLNPQNNIEGIELTRMVDLWRI